MPSVYHEDPPPELQDSFGWDDDDKDTNGEFERLYHNNDDDHESSLFDALDNDEKKKPWRHIHRTAFAYKDQTTRRVDHHCNSNSAYDDGTNTAFTGGLNPYEDALRDVAAPTQRDQRESNRGHDRESIFRTHYSNVPSPQGILRHSSVSRSASRPRATSRSRSRTGHRRDRDESLFRGAQLIKEQLMRSMDGVDREWEENGGGRGGTKRSVSFQREEEDEDDDLDYDYSARPNSSRSNEEDPSSIQSRLESESRRLDDMIKMFARTSTASSMSSSTPAPTVPRLMSEESEVRLPGGNKAVSPPKEEECSTASPKSTCVDDLNKVAANTGASTEAYRKQSSEDSFPEQGQLYAKQFLRDKFKPTSDADTVVYTDSPMISSSKQMSHPTTIQESPSQQDLQAQYQRQKQQHPSPNKQCNDALSHAHSAGSLWRSLVSNHVRFPRAWEEVLPPSSPPIERPGYKWSKWYYVARHRVKGDSKLNSQEYGVRSRRSGGRILMNVLVREMHSPLVCREVAVGCYHPNARGIRSGDPVKQVEDVREVWMSVRWVIPEDATEPELNEYCEEDVECFIDGFLTQRRRVLDYQTMGSPLGHRKAVNNENVRAVFGDQPPLRTVNLYEDELAEIIKANDVKKIAGLPGLMLLKLFLFSK